jgi:hypothetical protein
VCVCHVYMKRLWLHHNMSHVSCVMCHVSCVMSLSCITRWCCLALAYACDRCHVRQHHAHKKLQQEAHTCCSNTHTLAATTRTHLRQQHNVTHTLLSALLLVMSEYGRCCVVDVCGCCVVDVCVCFVWCGVVLLQQVCASLLQQVCASCGVATYSRVVTTPNDTPRRLVATTYDI